MLTPAYDWHLTRLPLTSDVISHRTLLNQLLARFEYSRGNYNIHEPAFGSPVKGKHGPTDAFNRHVWWILYERTKSCTRIVDEPGWRSFRKFSRKPIAWRLLPRTDWIVIVGTYSSLLGLVWWQPCSMDWFGVRSACHPLEFPRLSVTHVEAFVFAHSLLSRCFLLNVTVRFDYRLYFFPKWHHLLSVARTNKRSCFNFTDSEDFFSNTNEAVPISCMVLKFPGNLKILCT